MVSVSTHIGLSLGDTMDKLFILTLIKCKCNVIIKVFITEIAYHTCKDWRLFVIGSSSMVMEKVTEITWLNRSCQFSDMALQCRFIRAWQSILKLFVTIFIYYKHCDDDSLLNWTELLFVCIPHVSRNERNNGFGSVDLTCYIF